MKSGFLDTKGDKQGQKPSSSSSSVKKVQSISVQTQTGTPPGDSPDGAAQFILKMVSFSVRYALSLDAIQGAVRDKQTYTNMLLNKLFRRNKTDDSLSMEELMAEANGDRSETANIVSVASDVPPPSSPTDVPV